MFKYLLSFTIPLSVYFSLTATGVLAWFGLIYSFALLPTLELIAASLGLRFSETRKPKWWLDLLLYLTPIVQTILIVTFLNQVDFDDPVTLLGKILCLGVSCGAIGINVGHELGHRVDKKSRLAAIFLLSTSLYSHFYIEHNKGHHRNVGTPNDPATARLGESLYAFMIRSMTGCLKSAYSLDKALFLKLQLYQLSGLLLLSYFFGIKETLCFVAAAIFGAINLEVVNYIEHYGLRRKKTESGRYEKVTPMHSWNSDHPIGRSILFELPRHSDHHSYINRPYYELENSPEAPQLPAGYPAMIVLATIPPLFFSIMNPHVAKYQVSKSSQTF